ncbi:hypothetical protein HPDFL43_17600 [Hoeflea phototrophica DFL-43]|jgi:prolyl-tRNA editing enzyme YbaK/EbsC (Cys-tRNA(Pro) deacylase)|uniref:YbaK/aminoacyl-tRNA synthetase-associated domain-containing protein n=1 Tax=Hoeflea phototrophica (strain DSM 17068 / NCIMB 14078 / DFL-43) TaxID=411684 RepID=A9DFS1_HOEPD|nr:YbaK/EbsC family protein [Hoeflea phototrophica]EDQ31656.2 hypothetical protein HPDFL43_17600 [Hoeflea phototrophica DFL-43]
MIRPFVTMSEEVREFPDLQFAFFRVSGIRAYACDSERRHAEDMATAAARATCGNAQAVSEVKFSWTYPEFYKATGIRGKRVSTPFRQAFRFHDKSYRSISRLVDACMIAEYGSGVSFQCFKPPMQKGLHLGRFRTKSTAPGPIAIYDGSNVVHAPESGLNHDYMLEEASPDAVVRIMKVPGLPNKRLDDALRMFHSLINTARATVEPIPIVEIAQTPAARELRAQGHYIRQRYHKPHEGVYPNFLTNELRGSVLKTLICQAADRRFCLVLGYERRVDFKRLATALGSSRIELIPQEDVAEATGGFMSGAVTPFLDTDLEFVCDEAVTSFSHVYVNGGRPGNQLRIRVSSLLAMRRFQVLEFTIA